MNLTDVFNTLARKTDKGTSHNYIQEYYNNIFTSLRDSHITILEIGISYGSSIALWRKFFTNAILYVIDKTERVEGIVDKINKEMYNTTAFLCDAYTQNALNKFQDNSLDFIIDDGPHSYASHVYAIQHYPAKLKPGGRLIIEDVNWLDSPKHSQKIMNLISEQENLTLQIIDLREGRKNNNVIIEIQKNEMI